MKTIQQALLLLALVSCTMAINGSIKDKLSEIKNLVEISSEAACPDLSIDNCTLGELPPLALPACPCNMSGTLPPISGTSNT
jgi:hypothetical protein